MFNSIITRTLEAISQFIQSIMLGNQLGLTTLVHLQELLPTKFKNKSVAKHSLENDMESAL